MRELLERKRQDVLMQIAKLEAKLAVYDELLNELVCFPPVEVPEFTGLTPPPKVKAKPKYSRPSPVVSAVELALEAAGERGITARELSEVASVPVGTASGRLSLMKSEGRATHVPPRYFAVHSKHEDNNLDQGVEP